MSGHCRACDKQLNDPITRYIEEAGIAVEEDLCPRCLTIALAAAYNHDMPDEEVWEPVHEAETE